MFVVRPLTIVQDRVERREVLGIRLEPGVDVFGAYRDDATIVAGCGDLFRRLIGDRSKREQIGLACPSPFGPQACDQHVLSRPRPKLQDEVLHRFTFGQFAAFCLVQVHVLIEPVHDEDAVRVAELAFPKPLQVVPPSVVPELANS